MNLHALMSFYDEKPSDLARLVRSLPKANISTLIAVDGAYAIYPNAKPSSPAEQHRALTDACTAAGIDLDLHIPDTVWAGNETEKRTHLFRRADQHAQPGDWYMIVDADEELAHVPDDLHAQLEQTPLQAAEVTFSEPRPGRPTRTFPIPILFRATPGITVIGNHYTYRTPDGTNLWGNALTHRLAARHPLHDLVVNHWRYYRHRTRRTAARRYYRDRDQQGIELGTCQHCHQARAVRTAQTNWRPSTTTPGRLVADYIEICQPCHPKVHARNLTDLAAHGLDPGNVTVQHALGAAT